MTQFKIQCSECSTTERVSEDTLLAYLDVGECLDCQECGCPYGLDPETVDWDADLA